MRFFKPTPVAGQRRTIAARILSCLVLLLAFAAVTASAQIPVNPPVTSIQYLGVPNPQAVVDPITGPLAGIILNGKAISAFTGVPVRHLWVADEIGRAHV
jgi:hypothetical protein